MVANKYDWGDIKQKYLASEEMSVKAFIKQAIGIETNKNGGVANAVTGWYEEKIKMRKEAVEQTKKDLIEKMKINLEDLLTTKKILYSLDSIYLEIMLKEQQGKDLTESDIVFLRRYDEKKKDIFQRIQIELGQPTNISELQGSKDKPLVLADLVREAREAQEKNES